MTLSTLLEENNLEISQNKISKLEHFAELLHEWNQIHNLTGAKSIGAIYENILDSIYPVSFIEPPSSLLDVGTGAGFPGLALGIIWDESQTVLCEPLNKRASFLKFAAMELRLAHVAIAKSRVEKLQYENFALISSRAVTDTKLLLELTKHLGDADTEYLFYKGGQVFEEIRSTCNQLNYDIVSRNKRNYLWIKR